MTAVAAWLLGLPAVKAIGGLLLLWVAFKLLEREDDNSTAIRAASTLRGAIATILLADLVMSLDNVLGVAAASGGDMGLLIFGLLVSMAIVTFGGGVFAGLIDRLKWLAYLGAAVIAWTGSAMLQDDASLFGQASLPESGQVAVNVVVAVVIVSLAHLVHRRPLVVGRSER